MSEVKIVSVGSLKPGSNVVMDGVACRVSSITTSRPGKHGHAKCRLEAIGMIDGKKRVTVLPGHDNIESPVIDKRNAQVLSVSGKMANVMDSETFETFDMKIENDTEGEVVEGCTIMYWVILDEKVMKQVVNNQ